MIDLLYLQDLCNCYSEYANCHSERITGDVLYSDDLLKDAIILCPMIDIAKNLKSQI